MRTVDFTSTELSKKFRETHNSYYRDYYAKHKEKYNKDKKYFKKISSKRKIKLLSLKGEKCSKCGYNKCIQALDFHHIDASKKTINISGDIAKCSWEKILKESENIVVLCSNCHRELHFNERLEKQLNQIDNTNKEKDML